MSQSNQQWEIMGYDTRQLGKSLLASWRELLWDDGSPLKVHLDEVVHLREEGGERYVQSGKSVEALPTESEGVLLPEQLVLTRVIRVPRAAETDLDAVMALEVTANSPFPEPDTASGWRINERGAEMLTLHLAIVSLSATMAYLSQHYDIHDVGEREVWAECDGAVLALQGFGEHRRLGRYRRRLVRVAGMVGGSAVLLLLISGLAAASKYIELDKLNGQAEQVIADSREASRMRTELATANQTITAVNQIMSEYPDPRVEIERLTRLLGDEAYLAQLSIRGRQIKLRGRAMDAAAVMQKLTAEEAFTEVTAPQAIVRVAGSGLEQFHLNITIKPGASG
jgi:general secretion pathway protein L